MKKFLKEQTGALPIEWLVLLVILLVAVMFVWSWITA